MKPVPRGKTGVIMFLRPLGAAALILTSDKFDLQAMIARQFGEWTEVPGLQLVRPTEPDALECQLYSQEFGRGYFDRGGHVVMPMIAYGPSQSDRLQLHCPEECYVAEGFHVSPPFVQPANPKVDSITIS